MRRDFHLHDLTGPTPERIAKAKGITRVVCVDEFQNVERFDDPPGNVRSRSCIRK